MAAMQLTGTGIFNNSTASVPRLTALSFPHNASRVCFTSASKHSQRKHASEVSNNANEAVEYAKDKWNEDREKIVEGAVKTANVVSDKAKEGANIAADLAKEAKDKTVDAAGAAAEKTEQTVAGAWDAAKESTVETANIAADKAAEIAKAAKDKTVDAAGAAAEKTKEAVAGAWDAAKDKTEKIKEAVVGTESA